MKPLLFLALTALSGCAMQRASEAEEARNRMIGMSKEQIFTCMGIPTRKASEGETEIWSYKSGNDYSTRTKKNASSSLSGELGLAFGLGDETREKRSCTVNVVMKNGAVTLLNYVGPTGGFLTQDEQCAYAVRNCVRK